MAPPPRTEDSQLQDQPAVVRWNVLAFDTPNSQTSRGFPIALEVHGGEVDKRRRPYLQHSIGVTRLALIDWNRGGRMRQELESFGFTADDIAAIMLLHDVLEHAHDVDLYRAKMRDAGIHPRNIQAVNDLSYFPSRPGLTRGQEVEEHALMTAASPVARLLKPYDLAHNLLPNRLYPYLSAGLTVHSVWKYLNFCKISGIKPFGMKSGIELPEIVAAIPVVAEMLQGDYRLDRPPIDNPDLLASLDEKHYRPDPWRPGGLSLERQAFMI